MPKAVHDLAIKLQGQGKSEDSAWAIANSKTTKNDKHMEELMDQSPSMTNLAPSPQNTGSWPTTNPTFGNPTQEQGSPCDICGGPEHPPMDHPYLPRMPNDPMAMTQQPQMPMQMPMQSPMPQMPQQPPMQPHPAQTEGGMGSGEYPHGSGGGAIQAPSGGGQSGGGDSGSGGGSGGGGGDGGYGSSSMGGQRPQPGPVVSFNETIMKQLLESKVGCGCQKSKKG